MKLVVLACLAAAAAAQPDLLHGHPHQHHQQIDLHQQQQFDLPQQQFDVPQQEQQSFDASQQQQQQYELPQQQHVDLLQQQFDHPQQQQFDHPQQQQADHPQQQQQQQQQFHPARRGHTVRPQQKQPKVPRQQRLQQAKRAPLVQQKVQSSADEQNVTPWHDRNAQITSFSSQRTADGGNEHSFTTDNGMERQEKIELREVYATDEYGKEYLTLVPIYSGSFQFLQPDGTVVVRRYTTDEKGHLQFEASDLPQAPQAPQAPPAGDYQ